MKLKRFWSYKHHLEHGRVYLLQYKLNHKGCTNPIRFGLFKRYADSWVAPDADMTKNVLIMCHEVLKIYGPLPTIEQE